MSTLLIALHSSTAIIDNVRSDVDTYLGGGCFNSSDLKTIHTGILNVLEKNYTVNASSITVDNCSWNEDRTVNNITITVTVNVTVKDPSDYSYSSNVTQTIIGSNPQQVNGVYSFTYNFQNSEYDSYINLNNYATQLNGLANAYIKNNIQNPPNNAGGGTSSEDN